MFKLNFSRFVEFEQLTLGLDVDTGNSKQGTKEYRKSVEQNVIATNEKAMTSMDNINAKTETLWSGKSLTGVRTSIKRYKEELNKMKELAESPFASPKFKVQYETALAKDQITGMSKLKLKDASSLPQTQANKLLTAGENIAKKNITEMIKQQREEKKAIDETSSSIFKQIPILGNFNTAMNSASKATDNLSTAFKKKIAALKHAAVSWRILYGTFSQIWNVLSSTVEKAAAYQEALNLYTVALDDYAEAGKEWANKISEALFLDPKQIMQYTGAFYNLVQGLGVGSEAAYKMSTNLTQLSYDMSSYLNIDVEAAHDKLQSAMTGQSRAVASAGIAMQQASLQELAYSMGIEKSISSMTQAEKTYLRYIQIMRSTANMQGDLARTIVTPENALRVVKQQFELLARAIGNVFIPIVMTAIPYVMALTRALTQLATWLGGKLGFKVAEIDYSSLKTADMAIEDTFDNIGTSAGKGAKAVGDSVSRTLAAFDELNVVESQNKGGGGGGGVGGVGGVGGIPLGDLDKYVDGYDMLQGLTDELAKKTDAAYENLKKLWNVAKGVAAAFALWKGLKLINTVLNWADAFKKAFDAGTGIPGLFKNFTDGFKYAQFQGEGFFTSVLAGFRNILGPVGKFVVGIGSVVTALVSGYSIFSKWDMTMEDFGAKVLKTTAIVGGLSAAAFLLVSPFAAGAVAIAGVTGAIIGVIKAREEYEKELEKEKAYDKLFDGVGISIETLTSSFKDSTTQLVSYYKELGSAKTELDKTTAGLQEAQSAFFDLHNAFQAGIDDDGTFNKLATSVDNYKTKLDEAKDANIAYNKVVIDNLLKEEQINKEEYDKMLANISNYYSKQALYQSKYADELLKLDTQLKNGQITQERYNEEVANLEKKYSGVISAIELQGSTLEKLYSTYGRKINFKNEEEVKKLYEDLTSIYEDGKKQIEEQRDASNKYFDEQIAHNEYLIANLEKRRDSWSEIDKEMYDTATAALETFKTEQKKSNAEYKKDLEQLAGQYGNYLATINAQLVSSGAYMVDEMEGTYDAIKDKLLEIAEDNNIQNVPNDLFGNWILQFQKNGGKLQLATDKIFKDVGISASDQLYYYTSYGLEKGTEQLKNDIQKYGYGIMNTSNAVYKGAGEYSASSYSQGFINELEKNSPVIAKRSEESFKWISTSMMRGLLLGYDNTKIIGEIENGFDIMISTIHNKLGIHSPSTVFEDIGRNMMLGLAEGINNNSALVQNKLTTLLSNLRTTMNNNRIDVSFGTNVESSFNTLLRKLQNFVDKWRTGINDTLRKTANAFGSIILTSANKVKYSIMEAIRVPTFAEGGYPRSGDLFYANENGMPEYVTSLGNKSAVVNQDQMITALSNAIVTAVGNANLNSNQPSTIVVQIGNEKVYEGHGQYQNRQADRYGTTYVKI